ncbi:MAG: DUF4013 domain-containing protein [Chloroflexi bacterium]|nr:DUF4013 domain-containing protein [Chloroflexota bacterium]
MDAGKAFSYPFQDKDWPSKFLIGIVWVLLNIIPFIGTIISVGMLNGYMLEVTRRVSAGTETPLPEWDNLGDKFVRGILLAIIQFIWALPAIILGTFISIVAGALGAGEAAASVQAVTALVGFIFGLAAFAWGIFTLLVIPIVTARYAETGTFGSAFDFGPIFSTLRDNAGNYVIVLLLTIAAGIIGSLGFIACGVGVLFTAVYSYFIIYGLYGMAYRASSQRGTPPYTV